MSFLRDGIVIMRRDRTALIIISAVCLVIFALGIVLTAFLPQLSEAFTASGGTLSPEMQAFFDQTFADENVALTALVVFLVNLVAAALVQTTIPTLIIPFLGVVLTAVRMLSWGVIFTPIGEDDPTFLIHWVTLAIEGGAYVLVAFAAWVQGRMFVQPNHYGIESRRRGYAQGLLATLKIYAWVAILLVVGAIYEAVTLIFIIS